MVIAVFVNPNVCTILLQCDFRIGSHDERLVAGDKVIVFDGIRAIFLVFMFLIDRDIDGALPGNFTCAVLLQVNAIDRNLS